MTLSDAGEAKRASAWSGRVGFRISAYNQSYERNPNLRFHPLGLAHRMEILKTQFNPVDDELDGDRGEHEPHEPGQDPHSGLTEPALDHGRCRKHQICD